MDRSILRASEDGEVHAAHALAAGALDFQPWEPAIETRTLQAFMGHRSIANTVVYTAVTDKRIRNIWGK